MQSSWMRFAACYGADLDVFFPPYESKNEQDAAEAEIVGYAREFYCDTCPARKACRRIAEELRPQHGIWAGLTTAEREAEFNA